MQDFYHPPTFPVTTAAQRFSLILRYFSTSTWWFGRKFYAAPLMVPEGWLLLTLMMKLLFPLAPLQGWQLCFWGKCHEVKHEFKLLEISQKNLNSYSKVKVTFPQWQHIVKAIVYTSGNCEVKAHCMCWLKDSNDRFITFLPSCICFIDIHVFMQDMVQQ